MPLKSIYINDFIKNTTLPEFCIECDITKEFLDAIDLRESFINLTLGTFIYSVNSKHSRKVNLMANYLKNQYSVKKF